MRILLSVALVIGSASTSMAWCWNAPEVVMPCMPDCYQAKPLPPVPCPVVNCRPDCYQPKPLPPIPCPVVSCCPDCYGPKPLPPVPWFLRCGCAEH